MQNCRFITETENMKNFNPMEDIETCMTTDNVCIIRTSNLLPTLLFMQEVWWKLYELTPDDEDWVEYNILTYYKPKKWN